MLTLASTTTRSHGPDYWTIPAGARLTDGTPVWYHAEPGVRLLLRGKLVEVVRVVGADGGEEVVVRAVRE